MKKKLLLILIILTLTGCTSLNNKNLEELPDTVISNKKNLANTFFNGYKYYIPKGIKLLEKKDYNVILTDETNNAYYFYIDIISYYNKEKLNYKPNKNAYLSKELNINKKEGYLEINKIGKEGYYFIEYMYNFGKVEAFVKEKDIKSAIINMSSILSSLKFERKILETTIGSKSLDYKENTYNVMKPKGSKATKDTYLEYEEKYGIYEGYSKNDQEDKIEIED